MKDFFESHRAILLALVFTFAVLITAPGIGNPTGPTSKDEYHRVFRTGAYYDGGRCLARAVSGRKPKNREAAAAELADALEF